MSWKGRRALEILDDEVFAEAVQMEVDRIVEQWKRSTSPEEREELHRDFKSLTRTQKQLRTIVDRWKVEEMTS